MKDEALEIVEKERMMREAGLTKETLDKIQSWINNASKKGESND
jgi:hypothetical protein